MTTLLDRSNSLTSLGNNDPAPWNTDLSSLAPSTADWAVNTIDDFTSLFGGAESAALGLKQAPGVSVMAVAQQQQHHHQQQPALTLPAFVGHPTAPHGVHHGAMAQQQHGASMHFPASSLPPLPASAAGGAGVSLPASFHHQQLYPLVPFTAGPLTLPPVMAESALHHRGVVAPMLDVADEASEPVTTITPTLSHKMQGRQQGMHVVGGRRSGGMMIAPEQLNLGVKQPYPPLPSAAHMAAAAHQLQQQQAAHLQQQAAAAAAQQQQQAAAAAAAQQQQQQASQPHSPGQQGQLGAPAASLHTYRNEFIPVVVRLESNAAGVNGLEEYEGKRIYVGPAIAYAGNAKRFKGAPAAGERALILTGVVTDATSAVVPQCSTCNQYYNGLSYFKRNADTCGRLLLVKSNDIIRVENGSFKMRMRFMCSTAHHGDGAKPFYVNFAVHDSVSGRLVMIATFTAIVKPWRRSTAKKEEEHEICLRLDV